jgi:tetratricopeptide (TPR) repeat protein
MLCFVLLWMLWQTVSPEAAQHARAGLQAKQEGRLDEAIAEFKKVTELEPNLAAGFVYLGAVYLEKREEAPGIAALKRALELSPDLLGAHQMLGVALLSEGNAAEAIPHLEKAQARDALGIAQIETGQYTEAILNLQAALSARPNDSDLLYYLGRASGLLYKQAFDSLESAYPDSPRSHQALGENYAAMRRVPDAEKEYLDALRLRPDTPGLHLELGELYEVAGQLPKAEEEFRFEAKLRPADAEAAYRLGNILLQNGKLREARNELERADQLRPDMPETLYALGKAAGLNGDTAAAEKDWKRLLEVEKGNVLAAQAHFGLAGIYRKQGKAADAAREMNEFRKLKAPGAAR